MSKVKFQRATKSSRELRRIAQREQTREQRQAAIDAFWKLSPEERAQRIADNEAFQRISKNGITIEDMRKAEENAYTNGIKDGKNGTLETCFAAICLALNELHGFGQKECMDVLNCVYEKMTMALNSADAIQQVYDMMDLELRFNEGNGITEDFVQEAGA